MFFPQLKKFFFLCCGLFLLNFLFPLTSWGQGSQEVLAGQLYVISVPVNFSWAEVLSADSALTLTHSYHDFTPDVPHNEDNLLIIGDGRGDGGFMATLQLAGAIQRPQGDLIDGLTSGNGGSTLLVGTVAEGDVPGQLIDCGGVWCDISNTDNGPSPIDAPLDMPGADSTDYSNYDGNNNLSDVLTLMDGTLTVGQGRYGAYFQSISLGIQIPPYRPPGVYNIQLLYTVMDSTVAGPLAPDIYDPANDTGAGAILLPPAAGYVSPGLNEGPVTWGKMTLSSSDTQDWFAVDLVSDYQLNITTTETEGDVTATLYSDSAGLNPVTDNTPTVPGRYYIKVVENSGGNARYDLTYHYNGAVVDQWDGSDDACGSGVPSISPSNSGEQAHGVHTLHDTDSVDWFQMTLSDGLSVNLNTIANNGELLLSIYDSDCSTALFSNMTAGGNNMFPSLTMEGYAFQTYYIRVGAADTGSYAYNLYYSKDAGIPSGTDLGEHSDDDYDHGTDGGDDYYTNATPITFDGSSTGHILSPTDSYSGAGDWYEFTGATGIEYNFNTTNTYEDVYAEVYSSSLGLLENSGNVSGGFDFNFTATGNDTYYLKVMRHASSDSLIAGYDLNYSEL